MIYKVTITKDENVLWFHTVDIEETDAESLRRTVRKDLGIVADATVTVEPTE